MLTAFRLALAQLDDPVLRRAIGLSLLLTLALLVALTALAAWGLSLVDLAHWGWVDTVIDWLGSLAVLALGILLFPAIVGLVAGLFLDGVVEAVERRHYPALPPPRRQRIPEILAGALRFFLALAAANLVAVGLVVILPGLNVIVFLLVNGYLLGREYFELVAARRLAPGEVRALRRRRAGRVFAAGLFLAPLLLIPFVNLLVPIFGAAFMTHVFQRLRDPRSAARESRVDRPAGGV